jgi:hypothetical protein
VFPDARLVQIPGHMHSVTIHHAKHTEMDRYGKYTHIQVFVVSVLVFFGAPTPLDSHARARNEGIEDVIFQK